LWAQQSTRGADSAGDIDEDTLCEVMDEIYANSDPALAAFAEKSQGMLRDVMSGRTRLDDMVIDSLVAWQAEMKRITATACAAAGAFKQDQYITALQYHSARSERVRELERDIVELRPAISFTKQQCADLAAKCEAGLEERLRERVEELEERGFAPGSDELSTRIGLEFSSLRDSAEQSVLEEEGAGMSVSGPVYTVFCRMHGVSTWESEKGLLERTSDLLVEIGCAAAAADIRRQIQSRDRSVRAQRQQRAMRTAMPGM
jgi:hypothetical protein